MTVFVGDKSSIHGYTAISLAKYIERIGYIKSEQRLFFRGLADFSYDLSPSVNRKISDSDDSVWLSLESRNEAL